jgi:aspartate/methionine/tyrosine aminotransferase
MVFNGQRYSSILDAELRTQIHRPYIVTDSLSKGFEMYTFRVGFAVLPPELVEPITTFQRNFSLTPPVLSQYGAMAALNQLERTKELKRIYKSRSDYICKAFHSVDCVDALEADGGFYCILKCGAYMKKHGFTNDIELALDIAKKTYPHIGTVPCSDFGISNSLRVSFSSHEFEKGIDVLLNYFQR